MLTLIQEKGVVAVDLTEDATAHLQAAADVVFAYHRAIDSGRATEGIELFAEDAVFQAKGMELIGRAAIAGFLTEREAQTDRHTMHVVANTTARSSESNQIELTGFVLLHVRRLDGRYELERVLDTTHVLRPCASGWQILKRLSRPLHPPAPVSTP